MGTTSRHPWQTCLLGKQSPMRSPREANIPFKTSRGEIFAQFKPLVCTFCCVYYYNWQFSFLMYAYFDALNVFWNGALQTKCWSSSPVPTNMRPQAKVQKEKKEKNRNPAPKAKSLTQPEWKLVRHLPAWSPMRQPPLYVQTVPPNQKLSDARMRQ